MATADRLHELLTRLYAAHEELRGLLLQQQQAIRRFDAASLETLRERCEAVAQRILEMEQARARLTGGRVRLSELAGGLEEPQRGRLTAISAALRTLGEEIASVNRINRAALQNMLNHFHSVYQLMARTRRSAAYGAKGQATEAPGGAFLVDAVA